MNALAEMLADDDFETMISEAKPIIKWVGGKRELAPVILKAIDRMSPDPIEQYYEPFAGGLAIFFALRSRFRIQRAVLTDTNEELINLYLQVQNEPEAYILALRKLKKLGFSEKRYYEVRASKPRTDAGRAARFKYINACGYNGLWRVNKQNECNVPYGHRKVAPEIIDEDAIWSAHHAFSIATIYVADYADVIQDVHATLVIDRPFIYLDPPYWPTRPTASFTSYTSSDFKAIDQNRLAGCFTRLAELQTPALLSNSNVPATRKLYAAFKKKKVFARRNVNSVGTDRGAVSELLVESTFRK